MVLDVLGHGGMGTVLEAYDEALDRKVALKVLHPEIAERHAKRLVREAKALAKLSHPNVVRVYEVGEADGRAFLAMEMVRGQTLQGWQARRHPWQECVRVYLQAGSGLAAAHEAGLVHRDFKPDNCIIDRRGRVHVLDFGLVRELDRASVDRSVHPLSAPHHHVDAFGTKLTKTGAVLGTVAYMPLEQLDGRPATIYSDQFSFCVSLYEALYTERPFIAGSIGELVVALQRGVVRDPPRGTRVPARLRRVLLRGLAKDPKRRWPSMPVLLAELRALVRPRRAGLIAIAITTLAVAAATPVLAHWGLEPSQYDEDESAGLVEAHVQAARAAAARASFVYPPPQEPDARTAYIEVITLEAIADTLGPSASDAATQLREEFAQTLTRLGDRYWEREGGRPFAIDYYIAALVFDPSAQPAKQRVPITSGALEDLARRAARLDFAPSDLVAKHRVEGARPPEAPSPTPAAPEVTDLLDPSPAEAPTQDAELAPPEPEAEPADRASKRDRGRRSKTPAYGSPEFTQMFDEQPSRGTTWSDFMASMKAQHSLVRACGERQGAATGDTVAVIVKLSGRTGRVLRVRPTKAHAKTELGRCIANVVSHNVTVGAFDKAEATYSYIFHL